MANIFLDTNFVFDILIRNKKRAKILLGHNVFVSPLSYHIYYYSEGVKVPDKQTILALKKLEVVNFSKKILVSALKGPTKDLEDNIQLHSAIEANCEVFLTNDQKLQKTKSFEKMQITSII